MQANSSFQPVDYLPELGGCSTRLTHCLYWNSFHC